MATAQGLPPDDLAGFEARAEEAARGVVRRIIAAILRAVRQAVAPAAIDPVVVTAPAAAIWAEQAPAAVMPIVVDTWTAAAAATAADFAAAGLPTSVLGPDRAAAYITEATNRLVGLGDDIWEAISTELAAGVDMGESIPELAARIQAVAPVSESRATTIARTECVAASNAGSFAQAQVLDDGTMHKIWQATNDARTRPTHREADGQSVLMSQAFIVGGFPLMIPGDPTGPPEIVINCRCDVIYDFDAGALVAAWDTDVLDLGWSVVVAYPDREVLTADGEEHSGAMIALVPSDYDAARLEVGEPADELHTTLVYLGEDAKLTPEQRQALLAAAENVAGSFPPLHLDGFAIAIFNPGSPDRDTCVVLEVSGDEGPELVLMRDMVAKLAADALGVMMPAQHVPYIPHVTLAYTDDPTLAGQLTHLTGPVSFDRLRVAFGGDVFDFPLSLPVGDMPWDVTVAAGKFVEAQHKRDREGQFATMASRLGAALKAHDGNGDPFAGFTREQLRREATKQGITLSRGESQESISKKLQAKLGGGKSEDTTTATPKAEAPSTPEAPAAPTPDAPSEAQRVSDALEDIYVRAANGEITGTQARSEAAAHLDGLKLSAPALRDLSKQMGITVPPRATKASVRDGIVERRVGAPLQARALAGDKSRVEPQHKPVAALATPEPRAANAPAKPAAPRAARQPKTQVEFTGDPAKVTADLKAIRDRGTARETPDARGEAAAYLDGLKLTAPQMKALARELDIHTPSNARKQDIRDRIVNNQVGAHLAAAAIARAEPGKAAADAIERGPERKAGKPPAPDVSAWHGDLTPGQTQVAAISASPLVGERRQGGMMGLTSLEDHGQGRIIRKNVATRSGSADVRDPDEQADAEQLGVLVAEAVGLRPPAVVRTGQHELEMEFVEGRTGELDDPGQGADPDYAVDPPDWQRLDILDAVINNTDRNEGNYIVRPDGGVTPIDHSMAFFPTDSVKKQGDYITDDLTFTQAEAAVMRARIEATRPEFDRVGRGEWLDDTLARFDRLTFAPDPTPEASVAPARGAVDETRVADLQSQLDALETKVAPLRALELEATQKEFKRGYASEKDSFARYDRQDEIRRLKAEAAPLVDELMALLRERDGSNLGAVDDPDRDYWEQAKTQFNGVPTRTAPGVTPTQVIAAQKAMDRYRIDDRTTVLNNEKLRADDPDGRAWERRVQGAIDTSRVSQDSVFYRGGVLPPSVLMQFRPGAVVSDKGFQSTATKRDEAESYIDVRALNSVGTLPVLFEIRTRAGTPAGDAQYGEVVFGSGRSMRIISVSEIETKYSGAGFQVVAEWV